MIDVQEIVLNGTVWWVPGDRFPHIHSDGPKRFKSLMGSMYLLRPRRVLDAATKAVESIKSGMTQEEVIGSDDFCVYFYAHHPATGLDSVAELICLWDKEDFCMMPIDAFDSLINRLHQLRPTSDPSPITTRIYDISSEYRRPDSVYEYDDHDED